MNYLYPVSVRQSMAVIGRLGNDIEIYFHRHPLTLQLQMFQEPGDRTPLSDVDCLAIQCDVHVLSLSALLRRTRRLSRTKACCFSTTS